MPDPMTPEDLEAIRARCEALSRTHIGGLRDGKSTLGALVNDDIPRLLAEVERLTHDLRESESHYAHDQDAIDAGRKRCEALDAEVARLRDESGQRLEKWGDTINQRERLREALIQITEHSLDVGEYRTGLGCGVEDQGVQCVYEAADYGYESAMEFCRDIAERALHPEPPKGD